MQSNRLAILNCLRYQGMKVLIISETYGELEKNHIRPIWEETQGFARYNKQMKQITFATGSSIEFGACKNLKDLSRYQGGKWDLIYIDEYSIPEEYIKFFRTRMTSTREKEIRNAKRQNRDAWPAGAGTENVYGRAAWTAGAAGRHGGRDGDPGYAGGAEKEDDN